MTEGRGFPETQAFVDEMQRAGLGPPVVDAFTRLYQRYRLGDTGRIPWSEVEQPRAEDIVPLARLDTEAARARGAKLLGELAVIRLNGGLGTTMKLDQAKSLIPVRGDRSFLDLAAQQVRSLRQRYHVEVPALFMHSFRTRADCLERLAPHRLGASGLPIDFLQNKVPRIDRASGLPARFTDEEDAWAPPGHGDVYLALWSTGLLRQLLARGIRWAFVSNVDNLGATVDPAILGYLDEQQVEFAMEVTDKTLADIKGGTLIRRGGRLCLLEVAQVEPEHVSDFQDVQTFSVFNTNNLWWRLDALATRLEQGTLELPMIVNPKKVEGTEVVQLETAMGAAVGLFDRAIGIRVPRSRFAPVKTTGDLLAVRSDAYELDDGFAIVPSARRDPALGPPLVKLDDRFYKGLAEFQLRIPHPPSLVDARSLTVEGDVRLGRGVRIEGDVTLRNGRAESRAVPDGAAFDSGVHAV